MVLCPAVSDQLLFVFIMAKSIWNQAISLEIKIKNKITVQNDDDDDSANVVIAVVVVVMVIAGSVWPSLQLCASPLSNVVAASADKVQKT